MSTAGAIQLAFSTIIFMLAASAAKAWTVTPSMPRLILVLALYSAGNLIMLRLIREFGLGVAISLSAVVQLVAVNALAFTWFGERVSAMQGVGIVLAIAAVALITLAPSIQGR